MDAIWEQGAGLPEFPRLEEDLSADVLVIGGGLAGILCAWNLTRAGIDCVLIEENRLMHGVSGRTTAKVTTQHGLIYDKLLKKFGPERARMYWQANADALDGYRELSKEGSFDFQPQSSYVYASNSGEKLERELKACEALKIPAGWEQKLPLPFPVAGAVCFPDQAQLDPMKLAGYLCQGLKIYENTKALSFLGNRVQTSGGTIAAEKIIVATHFPILNKHGAYFMKMYQQRSYVIAMEYGGELEGMYLDCKENGLSLRRAGKWLLLGGGGHRTGKPGAAWELPERAVRDFFPQGKIGARWATQDCMTLDGMPYIGHYSLAAPNLYVATGFQKWGMTTSMAAAGILTDLLLNRENPYAPLFSPDRSMLHKQLLINAGETMNNLLRPTVPRCPHLGCALRWNTAEHSWDCPCHGSRFDGKGKKLNNPATDGMKHPRSLG